jgi:hypothetical protein
VEVVDSVIQEAPQAQKMLKNQSSHNWMKPIPSQLACHTDSIHIFISSKQTPDVKNIVRQSDSSMAKVNGQLANEQVPHGPDMGNHVEFHYWLACKKYLGVHGIRTSNPWLASSLWKSSITNLPKVKFMKKIHFSIVLGSNIQRRVQGG